MDWINVLLDGIVAFIRRNALFCIVVLMLALLAPSVLKGLAAFTLYFLLVILLFGILLVVLLRWRLKRVQREMEQQFRQNGGTPHAGTNSSRGRTAASHEGEVKVYRTTETPEKRIADNVGDYVEFEETKNN